MHPNSQEVSRVRPVEGVRLSGRLGGEWKCVTKALSQKTLKYYTQIQTQLTTGAERRKEQEVFSGEDPTGRL